MSAVEPHIASLLRRRVTQNLNDLQEQEAKTFGERTADRLAVGAGSWTFIICFFGFLLVWMAVNAIAWIHHWDPYPFILLNLILSCLAAVQAPIILMSQNREEARDRIRAQADFEINLKAELLLEHLTQEIETLKALLTGTEGAAAAVAAIEAAALTAAREAAEPTVRIDTTTVININEPIQP